jgi:hypothetical protein
MDFPKLQVGQYAVLHAEVNTGIVLKNDLQRFTGSMDVWQIFDSLESARKHAMTEVSTTPSVECAIYDFQRKYIETIRYEKPKA